ncbi:MAG: bifunctional (p)ppGpp synthetase/guanosine-3',5'-bis(diphosphate) 3'-pyrophosphohydrolase, partial [Gammaproteobacteria bacterium]|nr:bifunctional (p)ppGpp synthetase/guanosine-3',5'-bis(diphosphate) 3'-pyrophosphohydrolase [Gammaproteobacteria bacterium]
ALPPEKRRRIARETLDIYAPIAQRLGMNSIRLELEELGFAALYPMRHRILTDQIVKARGHRREIIDKIRNALRRRLRQEKIPAQIMGREKHLYGIYRKMYEQHLSFNEVYDVYAFRLLVDSVDTCYRALGVIHNLYRPVPGKFKDYIAIPKANGYQSLHTVLFGPYGVNIEVQIRTHEMNEVAESGIAAHWLYKSGGSVSERRGAHKRAREWLQNIMEMQQTAGNPQEFLSNVKVDLFPESVYVFTPKGKIIELPRGASAVDFAYAIHTDVGNTCTGARINKRLVPLRTQLTNGNVVEILTSKTATPNPGWLNFVITARARAAIRHFLKNLQQNEAVSLGKRLLIRELQAFSLKYSDINPELFQKLLKEYKLPDEAALLAEIGLGNRMAPLIARKLISGSNNGKARKTPSGSNTHPLAIKGTEGMVITFPKCCHPLPGDPILGVVTSGRGIVVHNQTCKNVAEFQHQQDKWIEVEWSENISGEFQCGLAMDVTNQRGMLATIATAISSVEANILSVDIKDKDDRYTRLSFLIEVRDRRHLADVMRRIRGIKHVSHITRK